MAKRSSLKILRTCTALLFITLLSSCEYVDFYDQYERADVDVVYEWDNVVDKPKAMRLALYPADVLTSDKVRQGYMLYDLYSDGRTISLPVGKYHVSTWNTDVTHTYFQNLSNRDKLSVTTTPLKTEKDERPPVIDSIECSPEEEIQKFLKRFTTELREAVQSEIQGIEPLYAVTHIGQLSNGGGMHCPHIHILWGIKK